MGHLEHILPELADIYARSMAKAELCQFTQAEVQLFLWQDRFPASRAAGGAHVLHHTGHQLASLMGMINAKPAGVCCRIDVLIYLKCFSPAFGTEAVREPAYGLATENIKEEMTGYI